MDIPENDSDWLQRMRAEIDEQGFPPESRRQLQANGFRCGIIGQQMPAELREAIDEQNLGPAEVTSPAGIDKSEEKVEEKVSGTVMGIRGRKGVRYRYGDLGSFLGLPRSRSVDSRPRRRTVFFTQCSSP